MANSLVVRKDTVAVYLGSTEAEAVTKDDKLVNLGTVGEIGVSAEEVETSWLDTDKSKAPGDKSADAIDIEQNLLTVEDAKISGYFNNGSVIPFMIVYRKGDGTFLIGRKGTCYITKYSLPQGNKGDVLKAKYTIQPTALPEIVASEPFPGA